MALKAIGTIGTVETLTVGGFVFADISSASFKVLGNRMNGGVQQWATVKDQAGTFYQVPSSKTLKIKIYSVIEYGSNFDHSIGYGDTSVAAGASAPTTPIYNYGSSGVATGAPSSYSISTPVYIPIFFDVPQNKYPFIHLPAGSGGNATMFLFGYEV
jgi:hypothetical protein